MKNILLLIFFITGFISFSTAGTLKELTVSCNAGDGQKCNYLGVMYVDGEGVEQDDIKAAKFYKKACDYGYAMGCGNLGFMYANGNGVKQDKAKSLSLYKKACDNGAAKMCELLGIFHDKGDRVKKDIVKAIDYYQKACDGGEGMSCDTLGVYYFGGFGVKKNRSKAIKLFGKACAFGSKDGCEKYEDFCERGDANVCFTLGNIYEVMNSNLKKAIEFQKKACENGNSEGCKDYQRLSKSAVANLERACDDGDMFMCLSAGSAYQDGERVEQDYEKAEEYYKKACNSGYKSGCDYLHTVQELYRERTRTKAVNKMNSLPNNKIDDAIKRQGISKSARAFVVGMNRKIKRAGGSYKTDEITTQQYSTFEKDTIIMNFTIDKVAFSKYYLPEYPSLSAATEANNFLLEEMNRKRFCSVDAMQIMMKNGITFSFLYTFDDGTALPPLKIVYSDCALVDHYEKHLKMCDKNDAVMCYALGRFYESGLVVEQSYKKSSYFYRKACDYDYVNACSNLGALYLLGDNTLNKDYAMANTLLKKSCSDGSSQSCLILVSMYYNGKGIGKNLNKAKEFAKKSCDLGLKEGCDIYRKISNKVH